MWAVAQQLKDVSYLLSDGTHLKPLRYYYGYRPWHVFTASAFECLAETFGRPMMKFFADVHCAEKQHISLWDKKETFLKMEKLYIYL